MTMTRREWLQQMAIGLLALGVSPIALTRHTQALAAPTPRKLALLVGIDRYGDPGLDLKGCVTDTRLQGDLLRYRFGFAGADILTLTGEQATRETIETAFREHLLAQAKSGDVVVFHFSGYSTQIGSTAQTGLIPADGAENTLLWETLSLLARGLETERWTMVLDTSYGQPSLIRSGNLRSRSYPHPPDHLNPAESVFLDEIRQRYPPKDASMSGIILHAAKPEQIAVELSGNGWSAGLFTYSLTQYLWEALPNPKISIALKHAGEKVQQLRGTEQEPQISPSAKNSFSYHLSPEKSIGGEAIITRVNEDQTIELTLTGLPLEAIENYGVNSCFTFPGSDTDAVTLQILARAGLTAKAKLLSSAPPLVVGQILQEKLRVFPEKIGLIVALDSNLSRIERVDATSAFATVPHVTAVVNVGERRADCLLSRVENDKTTTYHLLSPSGSLILGSLGAENEAVKSGVKRLEPLLETLLALKLWRLLVNEGSSRLAVSARLETGEQTLLSRQDTRQARIAACLGADSTRCSQGAIQEPDTLVRLSIETEIYYQIENQENYPLYGVIVGVDNDRNPILLGAGIDHRQNSLVLAPAVVPARSSAIVFRTQVTPPAGLGENYLILSRRPLAKTFALLNSRQPLKGESAQILPLSQPLDVARALWEDLRVPMTLKMDSSGSSIDTYAFDVGAWATLGFFYQVTPIAR